MSQGEKRNEGGGGAVLSLINKAAGRFASFCVWEDLRNERQLII